MSTAPTTSNCALLFAGQGTDVTLTVNRLLKTDKADAARAYFARASKVSRHLKILFLDPYLKFFEQI
jgi:hypothetical protein